MRINSSRRLAAGGEEGVQVKNDLDTLVIAPVNDRRRCEVYSTTCW
jgi:hypothetical protein